MFAYNVCVDTGVYVCMCVCMYVSVTVCICAYMYVSMNVVDLRWHDPSCFYRIHVIILRCVSLN